MTLSENRTLNNVLRILSAVSIVGMFAVSVLVYKASILSVSCFIAFILFYVQIPGLYLIRLAGVKPQHISVHLVIALLTGWSMTMLLYFITDAIGTNILLYACGPVLSILYFAGLKKKSEKLVISKFRPGKLSAAFCVFAALSFLFILLKTQYVYLSPEYCDYVYMNADKAYHMGLINSLALDYPLQSPWIQGRFINYHIFTEILYAIPVRLFGLTSDVVLSSCGPIMTAYTLCLSFYAFFRSLSNKSERAGIYCLIMLLSNIFIVRNISSSIAFLFAYKNENTAGYGIAGAMIVILMLKEWCDSAAAQTAGKKNFGPFVILLALIMCETGIKGPMGVVIIAALWGTFILGLIMRKIKFRTALPLIVFTLGFLLIYMTVLGSKGQNNSSGNALFALATISNISFWKAPLILWMKSHGIPYIVRLAAILLVFMVFMLTVFFLPFCIGYIRELVLVLSGRKEFDFTRIVIYADALVGLVAMFVLNYSGHSQIYFGLITAFFAPLISFWFFEDMEVKAELRGSQSAGIKALYAICAVTLVLTTVSLGMNYAANFKAAADHADPDKTYNKYKSISNEEYDAMVWIRDNTPEDSLLATDRYYSVPLKKYSYENRWDNRFFLYAVYSERFCYIAGSGYNLGANEWTVRRDMLQENSKLYDSNFEGRGNLARNLGIDYVVVSKRFTHIDNLESDDYKLCFTNEDVDIYEILSTK